MTDNSRAVDIIAAALPTLTHPGDAKSGPLALPVAAMRMDTTLPPEVQAHFAQEAGYPHADIARLFAEAIVNVIESAGLSINDAAEVTRLRTVAEPIPALRQVEVHCHCGTNLFGLQVHNAETDKPTVAGPALIKAVSQLGTECATGHRG